MKVLSSVGWLMLWYSAAVGLSAQVPLDTTGLDSALARIMAEQGVPGAVVGVTNGSTQWVKAYGVQNIRDRRPVTVDTRFPIGSTSKPFTATAVMQLVQEGRLSLQDSLVIFFPRLPPAFHSITLEQLLLHRSGTPRDFKRGHSIYGAALIDTLARVLPDFSPGTRMAYSNTGFILAGMVVEVVSGQSLGTLLSQRILDPLGMSSTVYFERGDEVEMATGYEGGQQPNALTFFPARYGAGGLISTGPDLLRWAEAVMRGDLLREDHWDRMFLGREIDPESPLLDEAGRPFRIGYGWWVASDDGRTVIRHGGSVDGFLSTVDWYVQEEFALVVLLNNEGASIAPFIQVLAEAARRRQDR